MARAVVKVMPRQIQMVARRLARHVALGLVLSLCPLAGCRHLEIAPDERWPEVTLAADDRILVLAPHPDDEILSAAGLVHVAAQKGIPVRIVFFTYGDNNVWSFTVYKKRPVLSPAAVQEMGKHRRTEAIEAAAVLGLKPDALTFLGYPDFGCNIIWLRHWGDRPPFQSMFTKTTAVPYDSALHPNAPYKGESILADLEQVLREFHPTKVIVSHPADHNVDHRTLYSFTRVALWDLADEIKPQLYPYITHYKIWPSGDRSRRGDRLGPPGPLRDANQWRVYNLDDEAMAVKQEAIEKHATQYGYSPNYLRSFVRPNELFGDFPEMRITTTSNTAATISLGHDEDTAGVDAELTTEERESAVDISETGIRLEKDQLRLVISHSASIRPRAQILAAVFGYRPDAPFAAMPKIIVKIGKLGHAVYDQDKELPKDSVMVERATGVTTVTIPLSLLNHPDRILTGARATVGEAEVDWAAWRVVWLGD